MFGGMGNREARHDVNTAFYTLRWRWTLLDWPDNRQNKRWNHGCKISQVGIRRYQRHGSPTVHFSRPLHGWGLHRPGGWRRLLMLCDLGLPGEHMLTHSRRRGQAAQ